MLGPECFKCFCLAVELAADLPILPKLENREAGGSNERRDDTDLYQGAEGIDLRSQITGGARKNRVIHGDDQRGLLPRLGKGEGDDVGGLVTSALMPSEINSGSIAGCFLEYSKASLARA